MARFNKKYLTKSVIFLIVIYFYCVHNKYLVPELRELSSYTSTISLTTNQNSVPGDSDKLVCEQVWDKTLNSRAKAFTSEVNPAHLVIDDYLNIVSENKTICDLNTKSNNVTSPAKFLIAIVFSARNHFQERQDIRDSWGSIREYSGGWHVRTVFLLGQSDYCLSGRKNETMRNYTQLEDENLIKEQKMYGDLVIGSVTDTYKNLTYKHLMGYKYILESCPQAQFIVKTDDDTFVNIPMILNTRMNELKDSGTMGHVHDIYCKTISTRPVRCRKCPDGKYFVTKEEWSQEIFPEFCTGWSIAMPIDWMKRIYAVRNLGGFFFIEDVFITGKLREIAEKEFGRKANVLAVNKKTWERKPKGSICFKVTQENIQKKQNKLPMYAHLNRNKKLRQLLKCLTDISLGRNLPFSIELK